MIFSQLVVGRYKFCERLKDEHGNYTKAVVDNFFVDMLKDTGFEGEKCRLSLRCLALCHNVLFDDDMNLNSSSPEELEFVKFCECYDFQFLVP